MANILSNGLYKTKNGSTVKMLDGVCDMDFDRYSEGCCYECKVTNHPVECKYNEGKWYIEWLCNSCFGGGGFSRLYKDATKRSLQNDDTLNAKDKLKEEILKVMEVWATYTFPPAWWGYNALHYELEIKCTVKELKQTMKELRAEGKVVLSSLYDESECRLAGSGWFVRRSK